LSSSGNGKPNLSGIGMTSQRTRERLLGRLIDQGIDSMEVLDIIRSTPRHIFLDEALSHRAYEDVALPIGHSQTISQPYVVAKMTEALLKSGPLDTVLEIGTGCGYQTAVMAQLAKTVYTVERINPCWIKPEKLKAAELRILISATAMAVQAGLTTVPMMQSSPRRHRSRFPESCSNSLKRVVVWLFPSAATISRSCN